MNAITEFNYRSPDYSAVFARRLVKLQRIRKEPEVLPALRAYYREHPEAFITDWGITVDPRNPEVGLPAMMPFLLFPKQVDWIRWVYDSWQARRPGVTVKSRELGVSWLAIALSCTLCLHWDGLSIGFGSRKLELVDKLGDPDSLFWKAREFMANLPHEFRGGWRPDDAPEKRIMFRKTGSVMKGEGGDEIGRGGRSSIYFVDEASKLPRPMLAEASLSATTNCRMDIGTANGIGGPFYDKVHKWGTDKVFRFHWRDDPRKDEAWYANQREILDPVVLAQEVDIDFTASLEGVIIPSAWVQAAIDADTKLGILPTGSHGGALDVADEGRDMCAWIGMHGHTVEHAEEWSGKGGDVHATTVRAFGIADDWNLDEFRYDADGIGSGCRGAARVINAERLKAGKATKTVTAYRGSGELFKPEAKDMVPGRKNEDFFSNAKAQNWWAARIRFYNTYRAITEGATYTTDQIISIPRTLPLVNKLTAQLSQPTFQLSNDGKVVVDKSPEGVASPDVADALIIRLARMHAPLVISTGAMIQSGQRGAAARPRLGARR